MTTKRQAKKDEIEDAYASGRISKEDRDRQLKRVRQHGGDPHGRACTRQRLRRVQRRLDREEITQAVAQGLAAEDLGYWPELSAEFPQLTTSATATGMDAELGTAPDGLIAAKYRVAVATVQRRRVGLGIRPYAPPGRPQKTTVRLTIFVTPETVARIEAAQKPGETKGETVERLLES